jgi:hypothetical protein
MKDLINFGETENGIATASTGITSKKQQRYSILSGHW